jgi:hypothetical protein
MLCIELPLHFVAVLKLDFWAALLLHHGAKRPEPVSCTH